MWVIKAYHFIHFSHVKKHFSRKLMLYSCAWNLADSIGTKSTKKIQLFHGLKYKKNCKVQKWPQSRWPGVRLLYLQKLFKGLPATPLCQRWDKLCNFEHDSQPALLQKTPWKSKRGNNQRNLRRIYERNPWKNESLPIE